MKSQDKKFYLYLGLTVLLLLCLLHLPYSFYTLVRFVAMVAFAYLAYLAAQAEQVDRAVVFAALALLFQPFFRIPLGRLVWNVVDVAVSGYLIYLSVKTYRK